MTPFRSHKHSKLQAFSLVEMLVSMAVLAVLMTILFSFFNQATTAWQSSEKKISAYREARAAFYYIKRDFSNMVTSTSVKWSHHEDTSTLFSETDLPPGAHGDAVLFLSSVPRAGQNLNDSKSDLCLIGYYLAYRQTNSSLKNKSYNLYRYFQSSDTTWTAPSQSMTSGNPITQGLLAFIQDGSTNLNTLLYTPPSASDGILAHNVINFEIKAYDEDFNNFFAVPQPLYDEKPDIIEISMTIFNQETAQKFSSASDWHYVEATGSRLQLSNAHTFHLRIPVK